MYKRLRGCALILSFLFQGVVSNLTLFAQGWLYVAEAPSNSTWRPNDVLETSDHEFLISYWDYDKTSTIIKLSQEGTLQSSAAISAPDTTIIISKLFYNEASKTYTAVALCIPSSGDTEAVLTLQFDDNLNILRRKTVSCLGLNRPLLNITLLKHGDSFKMAFTETDYSHHLAKFSLEGEILRWQTLEVDSLITICNLFESIESDDNFGLFATTSNSSLASMGVLVFDDSLQLINRTYFPQWEYADNNGHIWTYYMRDTFNSMMMPAPDHSGYFISARLRENMYNQSPFYEERSTLIAKTDSDFVMQDNYHIIEHYNDTTEDPAFYKSIDCYSFSESSYNLYQCCMLGVTASWPRCPLSVVVTKIDKGFNIVWKKRLLSGKAYSPYAIAATSDGGCIVVGWVKGFNTEDRFDLFALKVDADGTVGLDEIQEESMAFVYPNPAKETVRVGGVEAEETEAYNALGQCVMRFRGNETNVESLAGGVYLLKIKDNKGLIHSTRLVVNK